MLLGEWNPGSTFLVIVSFVWMQIDNSSIPIPTLILLLYYSYVVELLLLVELTPLVVELLLLVEPILVVELMKPRT